MALENIKPFFFIRPCFISDIPQCCEIVNYWIEKTNYSLLDYSKSAQEFVMTLAESRSTGCAFLVACNPANPQYIYGFHHTSPHLSRGENFEGIAITGTFLRPECLGFSIMDHLVANYTPNMLQKDWWTGSISESFHENGRMRSKAKHAKKLGGMFPMISLKKVMFKFGNFGDIALELFRRELLERIQENKLKAYEARIQQIQKLMTASYHSHTFKK